MKLYCVRHGEAVSAIENPERPLTARGVEGVWALAQSVAVQNIKVAQLIHSPRLRAKQTAELWAKALHPQVVTESPSGLDESDSIDEMMEHIQHWQEDTMLVGHMPFMSQLVSALVVGEPFHSLVNFQPGTIVCLEHFSEGQWLINWVLRP